ncbi:hypothetical protein [uncultured Nostoc sp.]
MRERVLILLLMNEGRTQEEIAELIAMGKVKLEDFAKEFAAAF